MVMTYKKVQPYRKSILADCRVDYISDERSNGDGIWIYLKLEYYNTYLECHAIHERTYKECVEQLNHHVIKKTDNA